MSTLIKILLGIIALPVTAILLELLVNLMIIVAFLFDATNRFVDNPKIAKPKHSMTKTQCVLLCCLYYSLHPIEFIKALFK